MRNLIQLSRRGGVLSNLLLKLHPCSSTITTNNPQNPKPFPTIINPNSSPPPTYNFNLHQTQFLRFHSSQPKSNGYPDPKPEPEDPQNPNLKHQEIEGPTVERDLSPLANETRQVSLRLMKTMYDVSRLLSVLALSQLALGAWTSYAGASPELTMAVSVAAFALPFSMAFMLRQSLKHMHFFNKMEQVGRLQILTSTMQISKHVNQFFDRLKVVAYLCLAGLPLPFVVSLLSSSSSS